MGAAISLESLFTPFIHGPLRLPNRFAMAPMTRGMSPGNLLSEQAADYYARRAAGGCGLIIGEATAIAHPVAQRDSMIPDFHGPSLDRWAIVAQRVHARGGAMFAQLWHTGLFRDQAASANPHEPSIAPSVAGKQPVRAMRDSDIADVIAAYATAAADARRIGFDGIEIHGAHGYLPDQFFWPVTNRRDDAYGGSLENRVRFAVELVAAIRRATGPDFPIMFRFSQWKGNRYEMKLVEDPAGLSAWLCPLADAGVDIFHASMRRFWIAEFAGSDMNLAGWAKKVTGKPAMAVGSVGLESPNEVGKLGDKPPAAVSTANLARLVAMFERGDFDLVALGRIVLANADWPLLARRGDYAKIKPFDPMAAATRLECALPPG